MTLPLIPFQLFAALFLASTALAAEFTATPPADVTLQKDFSFLAEGRKEKLDLYLPPVSYTHLTLPTILLV